MSARTLVRTAFSAVVLLAPVASLAGPDTQPAAVEAKAKTVAAPALHVDLPFEKYVLANGLEVILHEDHRTPVVAVNVWYHVGSKDEAEGKNGFAHLFEHVMFQGSRNVGEDLFFKYLERAGASERNGTTNTDRTNYFETVPKNELGLVLWLESDRMGFLLDHANEETFKSQREVVKNERRQNYENAPYGLVYQFLREALYPKGHPYHRLTIGTPQDLDAATFDDVKTFFRTYYLPNNATLVVAGDIDREKTRAMIATYFGSLEKGPTPAVKKTPIVPPLPTEQPTADRVLRIEAEVELPRMVISWATPPQFAPGDGELDLLATILSSGKTSRLYKRLVYDLQIAQDVSANQASALISSAFEITVTLRKGKSLAEALKLIDDELGNLRATPPTEAELARAKARLLSALVFDVERVTSRANMLNTYNQQVGDPGWFARDLARYETATPASMHAAAVAHLPAHGRVIAFVTPTPGAPRAGRLISSTVSATAEGK